MNLYKKLPSLFQGGVDFNPYYFNSITIVEIERRGGIPFLLTTFPNLHTHSYQ